MKVAHEVVDIFDFFIRYCTVQDEKDDGEFEAEPEKLQEPEAEDLTKAQDFLNPNSIKKSPASRKSLKTLDKKASDKDIQKFINRRIVGEKPLVSNTEINDFEF